MSRALFIIAIAFVTFLVGLTILCYKRELPPAPDTIYIEVPADDAAAPKCTGALPYQAPYTGRYSPAFNKIRKVDT